MDRAGRLTLRCRSKLLHVGVGRAHIGTRVLLLVADRDVWLITEDGELLQQLTIEANQILPTPFKTLGSSGCLATTVGCLAT
jgi:hypothetical protein